MAILGLSSTSYGNALQTLLQAKDIQPGDAPSYELCKTIYAYHPLGKKIVDKPVKMAQAQRRKIAVETGPAEKLIAAYEKEWAALGCDKFIFRLASLARIYGIATLGVGCNGVGEKEPLTREQITRGEIFFSAFDPLNTAGSLVINQDPNAPDFLKTASVSVAGKPWHRSRTVVLTHEEPLYIEYTTSAFGFTGRSVYQRALFPLKSFVNTMATDDMVAVKAGLLIEKIKQTSSAVDAIQKAMAGFKRSILRDAGTGNVLSVGSDDAVESLNLQNIDGAGKFARDNILRNIASAADMPAMMLNDETLAQGFGEGSEDAKHIVMYLDGIRLWLNPAYSFMDDIVMQRAWNEEFYATMQKEFPEEYGDVEYTAAWWKWRNGFSAVWPSLLEDEKSETEAERTRQEALLGAATTLIPLVDPTNKAIVLQWISDNIGTNERMFPAKLSLDIEAFREWQENNAAQEAEGEEDMPPPARLRAV